MKMMDTVEVIVEKEKYARDGVHKGMQGVIWEEKEVDGCWLVYIPQYGENEDIGDIMIKEEDLMLLPNGMDAKINERIKKQFENSENH